MPRSSVASMMTWKRRAAAACRAWFDGAITAQRFAEMRYGEQVFEIDVPLGDIDFGSDGAMSELKQAFEERHQELYAYCLPEQPPVLVNARVATIGQLPELPEEPAGDVKESARPMGRRETYLSGWLPADVYDFDQLAPGQTIEGPAIIESESTTVLLRAGDRAMTTPQRWLDISIDS